MVAKKKHPKPSKGLRAEVWDARITARPIAIRGIQALRMRVFNLQVERTQRLYAEAEDYTPPKGWTRVGIVCNDAGELCVWIAKGHGPKRRHRKIVLGA